MQEENRVKVGLDPKLTPVPSVSAINLWGHTACADFDYGMGTTKEQKYKEVAVTGKMVTWG